MFWFLGDPLYLLVTLIGLAFTLIAQARVKSAFNRYANVGVRAGITGAEAAAAVCLAGNVEGVSIERHQGFLTDHYDPRAKVLRLSPEVYEGRSVSAIAVAAHEVLASGGALEVLIVAYGDENHIDAFHCAKEHSCRLLVPRGEPPLPPPPEDEEAPEDEGAPADG